MPVIAALLAGTACGDQATSPSEQSINASASQAHTTVRFSDTEPIQGSFTSDCSGDVITYSGTIFLEGSFVYEPSQQDYANHGEVNLVVNATATGQPSGSTYVWHTTEQEFFETPSLVAPHGVFMIHHSEVLTAQGAGPDSRIMFDFTQVFTPPYNDEKVVVNYFKPVCGS